MNQFFRGIALFTLLAGAASADNMRFDDVGSGNIWWNSYESVYVSPYGATDLTTNKKLSIYCLDFNHDVNFGQQWTADLLPLTAGNVGSLYYGGGNVPASWNLYNVSLVTSAGTGTISMSQSGPPPNPTPFNRYLEAAYLFSKSESAQADAVAHPGNAAQDALLEREYNIAAWTLFISQPPSSISGFVGAVNGSGFGNVIYQYVIESQNAVASHAFTGAGWYAITPNPKSGNNLIQEFLFHQPTGTTNQPGPVPEPAAILLFGSLAGILLIRKTRADRRGGLR